MSNKSSPLDYVSTSLLKSCASTFSILISHLANLSFDQGAFPSKFKHALITPLLKKLGLSKSYPSNFRPISNLNTIGKILERLALARLLPHLSISPSFSPLQSAYRKFHSTETALLKLTNDIMDSIDSGKVTILAALNMSAAFDTLDHATLLHRLEHTFGLSGTVHTWIHSYLTNRSSFVKIDSSSSSCDTSLTGVLQGSVLGPLLFVLFISPVVDVIGLIPDIQNKSGIVSFHQYADDTQLYIGANSSTLIAQIASIELCPQRVHDWLLNNGLHLNPSKSEAIAFSNPRSKPLVALAESVKTITVAGSPIKLQSSIKSLGVYLDSHMSFDKHVSEICKASYFHIRALRHIRSSLTTEAAKTIAVAIVGALGSTIVILFLQARPHQILLAFRWFRTLLLELLHKSLGTATSRQFWPACTGSLYAIESISKLPQLLSRYCTTSSLCTLLRFFQDTYLHDHSGPPLL